MKYVWPIAKVRKEDGLVAVWLTHSTWIQIKGALFGAYVSARRQAGERRARIEMKQRDPIFDDWPFDKSHAENALQLYRVGMTAFASVYAIMKPDEYKTPNELIAIGDRREEEAYQAKLADLQKNKPAALTLTSEQQVDRTPESLTHPTNEAPTCLSSELS